MYYKKLAELYNNLASTTKRLEKIDRLSDFLKNLKDEEKEILYLLLGNVYPSYDEKKIGISNQLVIKSLSKATGINSTKIIDEWKKIGDLGEVSKSLIKKKKQSTFESKNLKSLEVLDSLRKLPSMEGKGTVDKKLSIVTGLLSSCSPEEAMYLVRTLLEDLRIGVQESTIRDALAKTFFPEGDKEIKEKIQEGIDKTNDIAEVFILTKKRDLKKLTEIRLEVGKPIKAMLAQKAPSIKEGFKALGKPCAIEYKYDGFRLIIHKKKKEVKLYTRNLENVTSQFPEVVGYLDKYVKGEEYILDSEAVGYDKKTKEYTPFQNISQRIKRKHGIEKLKDELPIEINVFDVLFYNGKSYLDKPFIERTKKLREILTPHPYKIIYSKQIITSDEKKAEEFYKKALKDNQEGIMMKSLEANYRPGRRVGHMLKMKPEERDYDLVITGAEYGTGKRSGWLSSFYLSCKSDKGYQEVGKVSTGLKEKEGEEISYTELTEKIKPLILKEIKKKVIIKPKIIMAVTYQEIQRSPNYESGFALRFPRFSSLREDKPLSEITDLEEIKKDFENQKRNWRYG